MGPASVFRFIKLSNFRIVNLQNKFANSKFLY